VANLLGVAFFWILHQRRMHPSIFTTQSVSFLCVGFSLLVLSRFGLALPALILDNCRIGQAMFRSDELTEGKWLTLAILLAKSLIGGYIAGMSPFWLAGWIWAYVRVPWQFLTVASNCRSDGSRAIHVHRLRLTVRKNGGTLLCFEQGTGQPVGVISAP